MKGFFHTMVWRRKIKRRIKLFKMEAKIVAEREKDRLVLCSGHGTVERIDSEFGHPRARKGQIQGEKQISCLECVGGRRTVRDDLRHWT